MSTSNDDKDLFIWDLSTGVVDQVLNGHCDNTLST
jgi:hypothetical protein